MNDFEIRVGMDPHDFSNNALCFNSSSSNPMGETSNFPCLNTTRGRYVSVQKYTSDYLQICEVQIIPAGNI